MITFYYTCILISVVLGSYLSYCEVKEDGHDITVGDLAVAVVFVLCPILNIVTAAVSIVFFFKRVGKKVIFRGHK